MKKRCLLFLLICLLLVQSSPMIISAEAPNSIVNDLFPSEEEMNLQTGIEMDYKKVPPEHYKWDSNLKFAEWDGIFPELKNPGDVTENTIWAAVYRSGVSLVRFGIFLMQMGFSTNILTAALGEIDGEIAAVSDQFFTKVFPISSTMLVIFMIVAWTRGQKGQMVGMMLTAFMVSTLFIGGIKYIDTFAQATSDIIDEFSLAALGILNFKNEGTYADGGKTRLAETGNIIWNVTVDTPWTAGQFGSLTAPAVLEQEADALTNKGIAATTDTWKELFLRYAPGSIERNALVDILADEDIPHQNLKAAGMMKELAPPVRTFVSLISFCNSLGFLIVAVVVAGLMNISGILLLGGMVVSPFMVPLPFLAGYGMNLVKKYLGSLIAFALLKVTALIYLSVLMLLLYLVSLIDWHFLIIQGLTLIILGVAIYLSPKIWKQMTPGLAKISGIGERTAERREHKKVAPQENLENLYERYANRRQDRSTEDLFEKNRINRIGDTRTELESLQDLKHSEAAEFTASGLEQREAELTKTLRKDEISRMDLGSLQNERFKYENKLSQGLKLFDADQSDLKMIQQHERQQLRSYVKPEQRKELEQVWGQQKQFYQQKLDLQKQKAADPLLFARSGGEVKMQYLNDRAQTLQEKEHAILRANSLYDEKKLLATDNLLTGEDRRKRNELKDYLKKQEGDSLMGSHLSNLSPGVSIPERQMYIESLSQDELRAEQETFHAQMEEGVPFSKEQKDDYLYMQHNNWMKTIDNLDERDTLQNLHFHEMSIESQLREMDSLRTDDFVQFEKTGGEEVYQKIQSDLYQTRQETQEVLRNSSQSEIANHHVQFAENRDMLRTDSYVKKENNEVEGEKDKIVEINDYRKKTEQPEQSEQHEKPDQQTQQKQPKVQEQLDQINKTKELEHAKLREQQVTYKAPNGQLNQKNPVNNHKIDYSKMTVAEYTAMLREKQKRNNNQNQ